MFNQISEGSRPAVFNILLQQPDSAVKNALLYQNGCGRAVFKENSMNANVNYCSVIILLRQLVAAGHCTKKEANRIAARIAKKTGADLILSM